jgi:hypothetical protein
MKKKTKRLGDPVASAIRDVAEGLHHIAVAIEQSKGDMTAEEEQKFLKKAEAGVKKNTQVVVEAEKEP